MLAALAAPDRLKIVRCLTQGPRSVGEIAELLHEPLVNVSHHLTVLRRARIIIGKRRGRFIYYSLAPSVFRPEGEADAEHLNLGCCRLEMPKAETGEEDKSPGAP
jgi:DNA-binding transcriptional ArsR family regulator